MNKQVIKITIILISIVFLGASCNKPSPEQKIIDGAIKKFEDISYYKRQANNPEDMKLLIKAMAGGEGWKISSEDVNYEKTKNFEFPLTANQLLLLEHPDKPDELIGHEQLFIYGLERDEWFPLSVKQYNYKNKEIVNETTENLWSAQNDWHEIFKEESDSSSGAPSLEELAK